jgi:hypothetical protein
MIYGFSLEELKGFKNFSLALGMLSMTINATKFAQICPKLPKFN